MRRDDARTLVNEFQSHRLTRRQVVTRMSDLGLSLGAIWAALDRTASSGASATPAGRGSQGTLKLLYWQAPTILNSHLAGGQKDYQASRVVLEPLLTANADGSLSPVLAADVPSLYNGGVSADGRSVTYRLKRGVRWGDGRDFTADDVVFTYQFLSNKNTGATSYGLTTIVATVEPIDTHTVKITFKDPTPFWFMPFLGNSVILPRHALDAYVGANARNAPFNTKIFGTGPYKVETFRPGDLVVYSINEYYREPSKPAFEQVQLKGGGDAVSAARAVLETGEYDYAWNLQIEWPVLERALEGGKGAALTVGGGGVDEIFCNQTDPNKTIDGQRSSVKAPHPFLTDVRVRKALSLAIDRATIARQLYGLAGVATANALTTPSKYNSKHTKVVFDIEQANRLLDEAGWRRGSDGIREKAGIKLRLTFATTVNTLRQKEQQIVKEGWAKIGADTVLQGIDAGVFFSSAPGNDQTYEHFYWDVELYAQTFRLAPATALRPFYSGDPARDVAQKENNWSGANFIRWVSREFNALYEEALKELDPQKNVALWIKMNDLIVDQAVVLPMIDRTNVSARAKTLDTAGNMTPFDGETRNIANWRRVY
jgi:peptide/nickel transport system substrate-binding protein